MIRTKDEFMKTFLRAPEYAFWKKGESVGTWETMAVNRHLQYNRNNSSSFKIRVSKKVKEQLPNPTLTGKGRDLRIKNYYVKLR